jgi:tRNA G18 (ribose-2'-O)-methylase SpoU
VKAILLENIRSAYNVGAIFRSADGAGVEQVYLAGYTPKPIDRFGRVQSEIKKTSLGASETIAWEWVAEPDVVHFLQQQQQAGVVVVALEQTDGSMPLKDFTVPTQVLYVVGNEVDGVSPAVLSVADEVVEIPMLGMKESLNVSVAASILLYHGLT